MSCSVKNSIVSSLVDKGLAKFSGRDLVRTGTVLSIEEDAKNLSMEFSRLYGESDIPFISVGKTVQLNESLIQRIDRLIEGAEYVPVENAVAEISKEDLLASMDNLAKKLGVSKSIGERLKDREGNPIRGVAAADILSKTIQVVQGNNEALTEEVVHFVVVAMAELNDPLYRSMRKRIQNEPEYQEALLEYSKLDTYDENDLIDEAITKVIVNRFQKEKEEDRNTRWWQKVLNRIKEIFDPFSKAADKIAAHEKFKEDFLRYRKAIDTSSRSTIFRSLGDFQTQLRDLLIEKHQNLEIDENVSRDLLEGNIDVDTLNVIESEEGTFVRYRYKGELVYRRVTDQSSVEMYKSFKRNLEEYKKVGKRKRSKASRVAGTHLHGIMEELIVALARSSKYKRDFNVVNLHPNKQYRGVTKLKKDSNVGNGFDQMEREAKRILDEMIEKKTTKKGKIDLYTELRIYNHKTSTAGTIDLLFVNEAGKGFIDDFKFLSPSNGVDYSAGAVSLTVDPFRGKKGEGYANQMGTYKTTLETVYGFGPKGIERARLIPGHVLLEYKNGEYTGNISRVRMGRESDRFLEQFPVADFEKTSDPVIDAQLDRLYKRNEELSGKPRLSANEKKEKEIIVESIKALVVRDSDITSMLNEISYTLKFAEEKLKLGPKDKGYLSSKNIYDLIQTLSLFTDLESAVNSKYMQRVADKKMTSDEMKEKMVRVKNSAEPIKRMIRRLQDEGLQRVLDRLKDKPYTVDLGAHVYSTPVGETLLSMDVFIQSEEINNEYFKAMMDLIVDSKGREEQNKLSHRKKWLALDSKLEEWGAENGISLPEVYDFLMEDKEQGKGRKMVSVLKKSYKEKRDRLLNDALDEDIPAAKTAARKWMREFYEPKKNAKELFLEDRKRAEAYAENQYRGKNTKEYLSYMKNWDSTRNFNLDSAWSSKNVLKYLEVKKSKQNEAFSEKYLYIMSHPALLEYYEAWKDQMIEFDRLAHDRNIYMTTVPNILPNVIQAFMRGDSIMNNISENILRSISIETENEERVGKTAAKIIPLPFLNPPKNKKGEIETDMISTRLTNAMIIFGDAVYEHAAAGEVEGEALLIREYLAKRAKEVIVGDDGTFVRKKNVDELDLVDVSANTISKLDELIDQHIYKQTLTGKGATSGFDYNGRNVLWAKVMQKASTAFSIKAVGFNVRTAVAALVGRTVFTQSKLTANENYTKEAFSKAFQLLKSEPKKYKEIVKFADVFNISEEIMGERASRGDWLSKHMNTSYFFALLSRADELGDAREIVGLMYNLGLSKKGNVIRLSELPEGTPSLIDILKFKENGEVEDESIPASAMFQVRMMFYAERSDLTGTKGRYSSALYQTDALFNSVMNLRSFIPGILKGKWGNTKYNRFKRGLETGLYRSLAKKAGFSDDEISPEEIEERIAMWEHLKSSLSSLRGLMSTMIRLNNFTTSNEERKRRIEDGTWDMENDEENFKRRYRWIEREFDLLKRSSNDPNLQKIDIEGFAQHMQNQVRAGVKELRTILMMFVASLLAAGFKPDEDSDGSIKYSHNMFHSILQRILLETSAFINPYELVKLNKSLIPSLALLDSLIDISTNTIDVMYDLVAYGKTTSPGDRSGVGYYFFRALPGVKTGLWLTGSK
jgi:hypothetical protein